MLAEQSIVGQRVVLKKSNNLKRHTIMKKVKLTLHGGFYNVDPINVHISARDYECLRDKEATLADVLSDTQLARVNRHFCGVEGCTCGGILRASWTKTY